MMGLSKEEVDRVAHLARLDLSEEMAGKMAGQLSQVLELVAKLNELDTTGVEPLSHPGALANVMRDDVPAGSLPREAALQNAPDAAEGFFRVPRVIE
jgi:aspartyl-tRNA(Asn)/glutamyl-tRNA(Gln) amidotransferase subunit C